MPVHTTLLIFFVHLFVCSLWVRESCWSLFPVPIMWVPATAAVSTFAY